MPYDHYITCIDRNGQEVIFRYELAESEEHDKQKWIFRVLPENLQAADWFEFGITMINDNTGKITVMNNRGIEQYSAKGIPEKLIEVASEVLNIEISSSSNNPQRKTFDTEWRTPAATKVWQRLVEQGRAIYSQDDDTFLFQPN